MPMLNEVDFKAIAQNYSHNFYNRYQKAEKELTAYWRDYCRLNNGLDYLVLDSQEYIEAEKLCEEAKTEHDERQKAVRKLYTGYEQANIESAPVFRFTHPTGISVGCYKYGRMNHSNSASLN